MSFINENEMECLCVCGGGGCLEMKEVPKKLGHLEISNQV